MFEKQTRLFSHSQKICFGSSIDDALFPGFPEMCEYCVSTPILCPIVHSSDFLGIQFAACCGGGANANAAAAAVSCPSATVVIVHLATQRVVQVMAHASGSSAAIASLFVVKIKADYFVYTLTTTGGCGWMGVGTELKSADLVCVLCFTVLVE
jgi:hypothetical protein